MQDMPEQAQWDVLQLNAGNDLGGLSDADRQLLLRAGRGLPLKLQLLGCQLQIAGQQAVLQSIMECGGPVNIRQEVDKVFLASYRALCSKQLQLAFLNIGMFMAGEQKSDVLDWCSAIDGSRATDVVADLQQRALVTWTGQDDHPVGIHGALRELELCQPQNAG